MVVINFEYQEGTIANPQHTESTESAFLVEGTNLVHFPDGRITPIPAFTQSVGSNGSIEPSGNCRSIFVGEVNTATFNGPHYMFGTHTGLYDEYRGDRFNVTPLVESATATLGTDPLSVTNTSTTVTVTYTSHNLIIGDRVGLTGATATGGVPAGDINIEHIVTSTPTANTFTIEVATAATSTTTGGGTIIDIFKQIAAGNEYQTFLSGYGAGLYGIGLYGTNRFSSSSFSFPRIWSFDSFGNDIIMCPGDFTAGDGQKIYIWNGDNTVAPTVLSNAPTNCNWVLVVNNAVIALCETDVRISEIGDATVWTGITTDIFPIERTSKLLSGFAIGDKSAIIFAPEPYLLRFIGGEWDLIELGAEYSIIAPRAACKLNDGLLWYGTTGHFYYFDGANVQTIVNRQNGEYIRRRLNLSAIWTTFMLEDPRHNQAWLYYPANASDDPDHYVIMNPRQYAGGGLQQSSFTTGEQTRTAAQWPVVMDNRYYMASDNTIYTSFTTQDVEFTWFAKSSSFFIDGDRRWNLRQVQPDFYATGDVNITFYGQEEAQTTEHQYGSVTVSPTSGSVSARCAGKLMSMQFSGMKDMTLGSVRMVMRPQGRRTR